MHVATFGVCGVCVRHPQNEIDCNYILATLINRGMYAIRYARQQQYRYVHKTAKHSNKIDFDQNLTLSLYHAFFCVFGLCVAAINVVSPMLAIDDTRVKTALLISICVAEVSRQLLFTGARRGRAHSSTIMTTNCMGNLLANSRLTQMLTHSLYFCNSITMRHPIRDSKGV